MTKADSSLASRLRAGGSSFDLGTAVLQRHIKTLPTTSGVYRMLAEDGTVLYVGKAKNLKNRVTSYTQRGRLPNRLQRMVAQTRGLEIVITHTESEALLLEANLIQRFMPPFNILLRDDKSFPFIFISRDHDFPMLTKHRGAQQRKGWYFGPFASGRAVTDTLLVLQRIFMLRNCTDSFFAARSRPCLQYHIKRCTAPCCQRVSKEDYAQQVDDAIAFLKGQSHLLQHHMADEMQQASDARDYEKAALLRDRIKMLTSIQSRQDIYVAGLGDADVIAIHKDSGKTAVQVFFFRANRNFGTRCFFPKHSSDAVIEAVLSAFLSQFYSRIVPPPLLLLSHHPEQESLVEVALSEKAGRRVKLSVPKQEKKKKLVDHAMLNAQQSLSRKLAESKEWLKHLKAIANLFDLKKVPNRIEVYDNSHLSGHHAIGAMIVVGPDGFQKKDYRKFTIKQASGQDDYGMMKEVLERRLKRLGPDNWPDLLLIDGGAGQTGAVLEVLAQMNIQKISVVGIAKGPDRHAGRERFFVQGKAPFSLPEGDTSLYFLQNIRDEAHRFAIGTHRARRAKAIRETDLDDIEGIGAVRKKALLRVFGSSKAIAGAGVDDLARVSGISLAMAKKIYAYYHADVS